MTNLDHFLKCQQVKRLNEENKNKQKYYFVLGNWNVRNLRAKLWNFIISSFAILSPLLQFLFPLLRFLFSLLQFICSLTIHLVCNGLI